MANDLKLRYIIFGGEALDFTALTAWFERHGDEYPQLVNMYGITETTVHVTYRPLARRDSAERRSLIGSPIPDLRVHILDSDYQPVPEGVRGELYVGGVGLALGYLNRPDAATPVPGTVPRHGQVKAPQNPSPPQQGEPRSSPQRGPRLTPFVSARLVPLTLRR